MFADGTLDIFAREQSISEENRFTVYGFSELGKRMRAMAMLVMIESITAKIKYNQSDGVATWVYVDEMHELWGEEYSLHALEKMWREVRKRGGICTGMSQNLIDAQRNRSTKTMVSNSELMLLLDQGRWIKKLWKICLIYRRNNLPVSMVQTPEWDSSVLGIRLFPLIIP